MTALRIVFIGCVAFSETVLERLLTMQHVSVVGVVTRRRSTANADFRSLEQMAIRAGHPVHFAEGNDQTGLAEFLKAAAPEAVFCIGWSYLLKPEILAIPRRGIVGYHPAALPRNRGRHPLIWALALGLEETGSTFFLMDEGADSGPILDQRTLPISPDDTAATLYARMAETALKQLDDFVPAFASGTLRPLPQHEYDANYWRKRGLPDGRIDWRMSARAIKDLVRALTKPYVGAHCEVAGQSVAIWRAEIGAAAPTNLEPGRVLTVAGREIVVKCWDGSIRLLEHEFDPVPVQGCCL